MVYGAHPSVVTLGGVKTSSMQTMRLTCIVRLKTSSNMAAYLSDQPFEVVDRSLARA